MALQTVNIYVQTSDPVPADVEGMAVRVFLSDDTTLVTEGVTDVDGLVSFTLDDAEASYILRFYKLGAAVQQPQQFQMQAPYPIELEVTADIPSRQTSPDPLMCRVTGNLIEPYGTVPRKRVVIVRPIRNPAIVMSTPPLSLVEGDPIASDINGEVSFDLFRGSLHHVLVPGWIDEPLSAEVPNSSWVDLVDFLFPTPVLVDYPDDLLPLALAVGEAIEITPQIKLSNGIWLRDSLVYDTAVLEASVDDDSIVSITPSEHEFGNGQPLLVTALAPGSATITATVVRVDDYFAKRLPAVAIEVTQVAVTVT